jgi:hypothetical protein
MLACTESVKMEDTIVSPPGSTPVKLFTDNTPNAIILSRILARSLDFIHCTNLKKEESHDFIDLVILISRKLLSVWNHLQAYRAEEQRLREKFWANPDAPPEHSQELYEEFDVFSVQVKSTLDHLVQMLRPVLGKKMTMYTFADKGERILRCLQRNMSLRQYGGQVRAMEHYLFTEVNKQWLTALIDTRDRVNHGMTGGLKIERFAVFRESDGTVHLPMWSPEQKLSDAMGMAWGNLFRYVEDFIALTLNFRIKPEFSFVRLEIPLTSPESTWHWIDRKAADDFVAKNTPTKTI